MTESTAVTTVSEIQETRKLEHSPEEAAYRVLMHQAKTIAASGLFGLKTPEQALALMLVSQAEGRHPALAARDYDVIQGRPSKKAEAMLRDFLHAGGSVEWHELGDTKADATFSHPQGGTVRITWDMDRAKKAGLKGKDMYEKYPRQMLRSRVVSEGVRTVYPAATSGMYVPEEVQDFAGGAERSEVAGPPRVAPVTGAPVVGAPPAPAPELLKDVDLSALSQRPKELDDDAADRELDKRLVRTGK